MKQTYFALLMLVVTALLMVLTAVLFVTNRSFEREQVATPTEVQVATTTTATTTTPLPSASSTSIEELTNDKGELIQVRRLEGGVTLEERKEIAIRRWTHTSGATATLYRTDEFYDTDGTKNNSFVLRATNKDGQEYSVISFEPDVENLIASRSSINSVEFSPLGTFLLVDESGYESSWVYFFDMRTGKEIEIKDESGNWLLRSASAYWNADESKLLLLSNSDSMGGCMDCGTIKFSRTGSFDDVETIIDLSEHFVDFTDVVVSSSKVTFTVTENTFGTEEEGNGIIKSTATFDLNTGRVRSGLPYLNN